ncbi:disease resistance protein rga2-like [Trifolium pratense]|uniref:Disease resistance protein rga2-like n=1 Tax=Trifolium pratense TaxID=57577 RepID=A0A2K3L9K6_TRIPR|nr:disease resistance protein rga2-like [Trifolium pratense]
MPELFVFDISDSLLGKLASYAYEEASRAYGVYKDLQGFKDTLKIVSGVLLDAEHKKDQKHGLREWLRQIQNICFDAEDVLDEFELQDKRKQVVEASGSTLVKVRHFFSSSNSLAFRSKMAHQIRDIRSRLDKVASDGTKFGLATINVDLGLDVQRRDMTYPDVDASSVIGREGDKEEIMKLLMQPHLHGDGDQSLCVIPIVGIGGLGKTTLAKLVFNDKRVDQLFQLKMWVCISDDFDIRQIIINIINSGSAPSVAFSHQENINSLGMVHLVSRLRSKISGQKFLLVLDDIWNDDRVKWIELKDLIKVGAPGSKVMVTTRSNSIASMMGTLPSYILEGLSLDNCISLFLKWAFKEGEEEKYPNLLEIGKEIVKKCRGVPLAVKTLGSSLFSKLDLNKWIFVRDSELWNLAQKKDDILPALKLSYDQLPSYLRQCFAYFSLYPKDYIFTNYEIQNLWIAHGLVHSRNGSQELEDVAREYIDELNSRSFLHDFNDFSIICEFKVHDLIHDLALYVAKEEFVVSDNHTQNISEQARHLSIVGNNSQGHVLFPKSRSVRTILFPIKGVGLDSGTILDTWISRYKYLRYLSLSDSSFETLPYSIAKLENLQALILFGSTLIPSNIACCIMWEPGVLTSFYVP